MPVQYACTSIYGGQNTSPPLDWNVPPTGTKTFALLMEDPDFPPQFGPPPGSHWVVFNMPSTRRSLPQRVPQGAEIAGGGTQGSNQFNGQAYYGPCPPAGPAHRYQFYLYALDISLNLPSDATRAQVLAAIQGHILAQAVLTGTFSR